MAFKLKRTCTVGFIYHYCSHYNNLVISDVSKSHNKILNYFDTIQAVINLFGISASGWSLLAFGNDFSRKMCAVILRRIYLIRWEAQNDVVFLVKNIQFQSHQLKTIKKLAIYIIQHDLSTIYLDVLN